MDTNEIKPQQALENLRWLVGHKDLRFLNLAEMAVMQASLAALGKLIQPQAVNGTVEEAKQDSVQS